MPADLPILLRDALRYRSSTVVRATRLERTHTWHTGAGSELAAAEGDWLVTDGDEEWTVAAAVFARSYEQRPDGTYAKTATVQAVRLRQPLSVPTLEGGSDAAEGDWLLRGVDGELWPVTDDYFRQHYAPAEGC